jgi:hypothetical protein
VDLAGCERVARTGNSGARLRCVFGGISLGAGAKGAGANHQATFRFATVHTLL